MVTALLQKVSLPVAEGLSLTNGNMLSSLQLYQSESTSCHHAFPSIQEEEEKTVQYNALFF